ncbi:anti-sigma regulatory factor (Ser/Thr protein kinase) [Kitasatospora sp. GP30]|nr:ATP-binding protein [Kitasatospora sp. GP30]MDH6143300.1 anti-sigma regulatory factor (Ser/Thr protein kinase) [Kitasatospora sp. GP30]
MMVRMAGWGEVDQSSHLGLSLTADAPPVPERSSLAALERLSAWELERAVLPRLRDPAGAEEVRLPARCESAPLARRLVLSVLQSWGLHHLLEIGELLTAELVANAVRHTGGRTIGLKLQRRPGWLKVEVRDSSRALPCLIVAEPSLTEYGRGLTVVDALADRWGADLLPRGKGVWFELKVRERA